MHSNRLIAFAQLSTLLLSLNGCFGTSPTSNFYLLEPIAEIQSITATTGTKPLIALAPVKIPDYIDRPQIVTATGRNAYRLDEYNRWAEPLSANIARVLQQDLTILVPAEVVTANASGRMKQAQFRVSLNILEFHVDAQNQALLTAQWYIFRNNATVASRQISYRIPAAKDDYRTMVEALNACLHGLSRDLAVSLRQIAGQK